MKKCSWQPRIGANCLPGLSLVGYNENGEYSMGYVVTYSNTQRVRCNLIFDGLTIREFNFNSIEEAKTKLAEIAKEYGYVIMDNRLKNFL